MTLKIFDRIRSRVDTASQQSETDHFLCLMYYGEAVIKTVAAGLVAGLVNGKLRARYGFEYRLLRENGIGGWGAAIDEMLTGPASSCFVNEFKEIRSDITAGVKAGSWQYEAVALLNDVLGRFSTKAERMPAKVSLRKWFSDFAYLRNKTRGHGAPCSVVYQDACAGLQASIDVIANNLKLFTNVEWAYLHQNMSRKYRVIKVTENTEKLDELKRIPCDRKYDSALYLLADKPRCINLIRTDIDAAVFWFPNGEGGKNKFEYIEYVEGKVITEDNTSYLTPPEELPASETRGLTGLTVQGNVFGNIPPVQAGYIDRPSLENELIQVLHDARNPVITLVGRGGIGKTSSVLKVLHQVADSEAFGLILWFSARDIDLLPDGPRPVRPEVTTVDEMATEYAELLDPEDHNLPAFDKIEYFQTGLSAPIETRPTIFVFDNFETVKDPVSTYKWLNSYIRLPNKVIITTRHRDFKGDFPIEVLGMTKDQAAELMRSYGKRLGVEAYLNQGAVDKIYAESDGHPYIIKVLVGEILRTKKVVSIKSLVASKEDLLDALFDRTYANLSEPARRIFLTLCSWHSYIPEVALEAILLRSSVGEINVQQAISELVNSSFAERYDETPDESAFISVPMTSALFGKKKLSVSPYKLDIESDMQILQLLGASQSSEASRGIDGKIRRFIRSIFFAKGRDQKGREEMLPMLEFIAKRYPPAWLMLSDELTSYQDQAERCKEYIRSYIASTSAKTDLISAWDRVARLCKSTGDVSGELHSLYEMVLVSGIEYDNLSSVANRVNVIFSERQQSVSLEKKELVISSVAGAMYKRLSEADATDMSRLAWLYVHLRDEGKAIRICEAALEIEPTNPYCTSLLQRLGSH